MKHILFALFLVAFAPLFAAPAAADTAADNAYLALVDTAQKTPDTANWTALRTAYTKTSFYAAGGGFEQAKTPRDALKKAQAEKTPAAAAAFKEALRQHYADIDTLMHVLYTDSQSKIDGIDRAAIGQALKGLLDSILATGNGKSMKTAFKTITHDEENAIAQGIYNLQIISRHVESGHGRIFSTLTVREAQGPEMEMFFDITDRWANTANPKRAEKPAAYTLPQMPDDAADADKTYMALVTAAQKNPAAANWDALRKAYGGTSFYAQTGPIGATALAARTAQYDANRGTPESQSAFNKIYRQHFASIGVQKIADDLKSRGQGGNIDGTVTAAARAGLLNSVMKSGDGKTPATAFQIVTGSEIEEIVPALLENPLSSGVAIEDGKVLSRFKGKDRKTGIEAEYIFMMPGGLPGMVKPANDNAPPAPPAKDRSEADARYLALADTAIAAPGTADYAALRTAYAHTSFYHPYGAAILSDTLNKSLKDALASPAQVGAYQDTVRKHAAHFVTHLHALSAAHSEKPVFINADAHRKHMDGIITSILKSGDGRTPQTAFTVIDIQEEYMLMKEVLKIDGKKRPTLQQNGHVYDVFDYTAKNGSTATIYFNVDLIFARDPAE